MNSIIIALLTVVAFYLAYRWYGSKISNTVELNNANKTPAVSINDGIDFVPTAKQILFGHHFASIAGAGPIIGPVLAALYFGWLPALVWIILGSIFIGGVHDFTSMVASLRHQGRSIADIAENTISRRAKILFATFLWLALILIICVFAVVAGKSLAVKPEVVFPTLMIIPVAILFGFLVYKLRVNVLIASTIGVGLLFVFIWIGINHPIVIASDVGTATKYWTVILLVYSLIASILPVWVILQPRDYLSTSVLFLGLTLGYIGLLISHPTINAPPVVAYNAKPGPIWPMLFVIVACGAISGFHSLVASGTTSKQVEKEEDAKAIGYGGTLTEGILAVMALLAVIAGLYWKGDSALSFPVLMKEKGWIVTFATGYGQLTKPLLGATLGTLFGIIVIKTFVLTTLDTATRLGRFIGTELFGSRGVGINAMDNRYVSTIVILIPAAYLALTGDWQKVWPVFGAANQLIAALTLFVVTMWLVESKKPTKYTLYPAIFMAATTIGALLYLTFVSFLPKGKYLLAGVSLVLLALALLMVSEVWKKWQKVSSKV